jgi:hypothetical protein
MVSKCLALDVSLSKLQKNMFDCPLKLILGFFEFFGIFCYEQKYSYTIIYECENSPLSHELT